MGKILFDVFEINIAVSIVILLVALLAEFLRKRYGAGWLKIVWILLAVRLLIPYNFSLPNTEIRLFSTPGFEQEMYTEPYMNEEALLSDEIMSETDELLSGKDTDIAETMPEQEMQSPAAQMVHGTNLTMHEENSDYHQTGKELPLSEKQMNDVAEETVETNALLYTRILLCVWGIGVIAFGVYYAFAYMWFQYRSHKKLCPILDEALRERIEYIQLKYLSKVKCSVYESEVITTPMLMGIFAPKLVLPTDRSNAENIDKNERIPTERWSDEELEMVVAHELCHYQNKDLWLKIIMLIACCINWFNPAVHFMKKQFFYDLELACDYRVLRNCNANEKQQYSEVLLKYAGKETSFSAGLSADKKRLKNRISHMWENEKKKSGIPAFILIAVLLISVGLFISFGYKPEEVSDEPITEPNPVSDESVAEHNEEQYAENNMEQANGESGEAKKSAPTKDEVMAMRSVVLEGMSEDDIARLTENIKVANLVMESAYLNNDLFGKLSDANSPYWQYFDKVGEIQLGWWYNQTIVDKEVILKQEGITESEFDEEVYPPGMGYNRFDAANFIALMEEMQSFVQNEALKTELQQLIDLTYMASVTHEMEYANQVYKILHDLDYFLLRYGIEDVGKYTQDLGTVSKYYGVLTVYGATPFQVNETNSYNILHYKTVESDWTKYGKMETIHEEFTGEDGSVNFYYDMECFYFDETYPTVLNERLQEYYDSVEEAYLQDAQVYDEPFEENYDTPYNNLIFQYFTYIGEDYVSLVYNDVSYMGGAHPYSSMKGITIDCSTGEIVCAQQFLNDSDEVIGERLQAVLGTDSAIMDGWEFYLTKTSVVFFYYDPKYWDSVAVRRVR